MDTFDNYLLITFPVLSQFHGFGPRRAASEHDRLYNLANERTAFRWVPTRPPRFAFFSQVLEEIYCFL